MKMNMGMVIVVVAVATVIIGTWVLTLTQGRERFIVSTTTSLYETGLLGILESKFEEKHLDLNVSFISQGTGLAIQSAMRGDADMILVHDPAREEIFLNDGYGVNRKIIAYNYFVIVGPEEDPAEVEGLDPVNALLKIKAAGEGGKALWVSRGDDSGTHAKEKGLWNTGGEEAAELRDWEWYLEAGLGMTATLNLADEKRAYTLCDLGSYLNNYALGNIDLVIVVESGKDTLNVYSAIACDPRKTNLEDVNFNYTVKFIDFLVSDDVQGILADFGVDEFGQPLFHPAVEVLEANTDPETASWIRELAFIDGTECPLENRYESGGLDFLGITPRELLVKGESSS